MFPKFHVSHSTHNEIKKMEASGKKRGGRPPKATRGKLNLPVAHVTADTLDDSNDNSQTLEISALAISPIPDELGSPCSATSVGECRRSSRKKIIKFDVRDLLNKNRKPHKIQIEARIDSNAPTPKRIQGVQATTPSSTKILVPDSTTSTNKQKNFLEKSAIFQKYSITTTAVKPPPAPTFLVKGDSNEIDLNNSTSNLLRAKRSCSLIVAKTESTTRSVSTRKGSIASIDLTLDEATNATILKGRQAAKPIVATNDEKLESEREETITTPVIKRRGRASKVKNEPVPLIHKPDLEEEKVSQSNVVVSLNNENKIQTFCEHFMNSQDGSLSKSIEESLNESKEALESFQSSSNLENKKSIEETNIDNELKKSETISETNEVPPTSLSTEQPYSQYENIFGGKNNQIDNEQENSKSIEPSPVTDLSKQEMSLAEIIDNGNLNGVIAEKHTAVEQTPNKSNDVSSSENHLIEKEYFVKNLPDKASSSSESLGVDDTGKKDPLNIADKSKCFISSPNEVPDEKIKKTIEEEQTLNKRAEGTVLENKIQDIEKEVTTCGDKLEDESSTRSCLKVISAEDGSSPKPILSLPPKKKLSRLLQSKSSIGESAEDLSNPNLLEELKEPSSSPNHSKGLFTRSNSQSPSLTKKSTRRSDRRSQIGAKAKTLEEMFAEIAAESSREVLQSPLNIIDEDSSNSSSAKCTDSIKLEVEDSLQDTEKVCEEEVLSVATESKEKFEREENEVHLEKNVQASHEGLIQELVFNPKNPIEKDLREVKIETEKIEPSLEVNFEILRRTDGGLDEKLNDAILTSPRAGEKIQKHPILKNTDTASSPKIEDNQQKDVDLSCNVEKLQPMLKKKKEKLQDKAEVDTKKSGNLEDKHSRSEKFKTVAKGKEPVKEKNSKTLQNFEEFFENSKSNKKLKKVKDLSIEIDINSSPDKTSSLLEKNQKKSSKSKWKTLDKKVKDNEEHTSPSKDVFYTEGDKTSKERVLSKKNIKNVSNIKLEGDFEASLKNADDFSASVSSRKSKSNKSASNETCQQDSSKSETPTPRTTKNHSPQKSEAVQKKSSNHSKTAASKRKRIEDNAERKDEHLIAELEVKLKKKKQRKLNEALETVSNESLGENIDSNQNRIETVQVQESEQQPEKSFKENEEKISKSTSSKNNPDPLDDIEKFIADGVSLLKKDFTLDEEQTKVEGGEGDVGGEGCKETTNSESVNHSTFDEGSSEVLSINESAVTLKLEDLTQKSFYTDSAFSKGHELMDPMMSTYLTPANTPADSPIHTPLTSPCPASPVLPDTPQSYDGEESPAVRRSHRLKQSVKGPKEGRGLVKEKERVLMKEDGETKIPYSLDDHLTDLAEVEAINAKFLKEMEERLCNFQVIRENDYHCERVISKEAKKMLCECFLTLEEEDRGELGCGDDCLNRLLMIECGSNCKVKDRCTNKRFQKQFYAPCRVFRTEKKGFGIMADIEILAGEFIMEYVGEVINGDELKKRQLAYSKDKNRHYYFMALRGDTTIDATTQGNISRFINHSCDPNAETQKWTVNGELRIGFFSLRSIKPGEEITFNYQYERYGRAAQRCYCESSNCTGWIGEEPNSDEDEQIDGSDSESDEIDEGDDEEEEEVEDKVARGLSECLLSVDDESSDEETLDRGEAQKKLEMAAAEASLTEALSPEEKQRFKDESVELEKTGFGKDAKAKLRLLFNKLKERAEEKKKLKKEKKTQKRRLRKEPQSKARLGPCEDPEVEDDLNFLLKCGLKNQSDTLRLSRLMVRAKLHQTRLDLLKVLTMGELACRRLFLDYNGLHLLHGWMSENADDLSIRSAILEALKSLPLANKTILKDTKVFQTVLNWSGGGVSEDATETSPSEDSASTESPTENNAENQVTSEEVSKPETQEPESLEPTKKLASELINNWNNLPEIFRIPKKERIEQMKEHEREADLQYEAAGEDDLRSSYIDRYGRDRYGEDRNSANTEARKRFSQMLSDESLKHLSKKERRELFAAKVAKDEEEKKANEKRREFETKCRFFGLNIDTTNPDDMPFYVNHDTGQWYSIKEKTIETPPAYAHVAVPQKPTSTNPEDYELPDVCSTLPSYWKFAITPEGYIYYYHIEHRIPQWEPPSSEQLVEVHSDSDSEINHEDDELLLSLNDDQLKEYIKKKADARIEKRNKRLFESRPISPRREEDRIYNQIEMRKYKENKEKIKRRKEKLRRRSVQMKKGEKALTNQTSDKEEDDPNAVVRIPDYLLSSDEETDVLETSEIETQEPTDNNAIVARRSSLLDKIVDGDKIVDELDAITLNKTLKRQLPPHGEIPKDNLTESPCSSASLTSQEISFNLDQTASSEIYDSKKRKIEKKEKEKMKKLKEITESKLRRHKEKFRHDIGGIIVHFLKPFYNESCTKGRIQNEQDFKHLSRKLTHFVMVKEQKYCESIGQKLVVTESVKNKTREFIRKYMGKYGEVYKRSENDPEYKNFSSDK